MLRLELANETVLAKALYSDIYVIVGIYGSRYTGTLYWLNYSAIGNPRSFYILKIAPTPGQVVITDILASTFPAYIARALLA